MKMDVGEIVFGCGLDSSDTGQGSAAVIDEDGYKLTGSIK
jgi:hypothetical protein